MSITPTYYEINVSKNGKHFFATAPRSIVTRAKLGEVWEELDKRFPEEEGYGIMVTKQYQYGELLNMTREDPK